LSIRQLHFHAAEGNGQGHKHGEHEQHDLRQGDAVQRAVPVTRMGFSCLLRRRAHPRVIMAGGSRVYGGQGVRRGVLHRIPISLFMPRSERIARSISRSAAAGERRRRLQQAFPAAWSILPQKEAIDRRLAVGAADAVVGRERVEPELYLRHVETPVAIAIGLAAGIDGGLRAIDRLHDGETAGIPRTERAAAIAPGGVEPALDA
jgi:hypothetical protein